MHAPNHGAGTRQKELSHKPQGRYFTLKYRDRLADFLVVFIASRRTFPERATAMLSPSLSSLCMPPPEGFGGLKKRLTTFFPPEEVPVVVASSTVCELGKGVKGQSSWTVGSAPWGWQNPRRRPRSV